MEIGVDQTQQPVNVTSKKPLVLLIVLVILIIVGVVSFVLFNKTTNPVMDNSQMEKSGESVVREDKIPSNMECMVFDDVDEAIRHVDIACGLNLSGKNLSSLSKEVTQLKNLNWLILNNNNFTTIPKELASLPSLVEIDLADNDISEIPSYISEFKALQSIRLNNNKLSSLSGIENVKTINYIDVSGNNISQSNIDALNKAFADRVSPVEIVF